MRLFAFLFVFPTFIACVSSPPPELDGVADQDAHSAEYPCVSNCSVDAVPINAKETEACDGSDLGCTPEDDHYVQEPLKKRGKTLKKPTTSEAKVTPKKTTPLMSTTTQAKSTPITTSSVKTSAQVETTLKSQTTTSELSKSTSQTELSSSKSAVPTSSAKPSSTPSITEKTPASTSSGTSTLAVPSGLSTTPGVACNIQRAPAQRVVGKQGVLRN